MIPSSVLEQVATVAVQHLPEDDTRVEERGSLVVNETVTEVSLLGVKSRVTMRKLGDELSSLRKKLEQERHLGLKLRRQALRASKSGASLMR